MFYGVYGTVNAHINYLMVMEFHFLFFVERNCPQRNVFRCFWLFGTIVPYTLHTTFMIFHQNNFSLVQFTK